MAPSLFGWDVEFDRIGKEEKADLVIVSNRRKGQNRADFCHHLPFGAAGRTEIAGTADVDHQHDGHFPFFGEFLDMGDSGTGGDIPVDCPDIVTRNIFADLVEVHAAAFENRLITAGKAVVDQPVGPHLNLTDFFQDFPGKQSIHGRFDLKSGNRNRIEDFPDDILTADPFGLRFITDSQPVPHDIHHRCFDIIRCHIAPAGKKSKTA